MIFTDVRRSQPAAKAEQGPAVPKGAAAPAQAVIPKVEPQPGGVGAAIVVGVQTLAQNLRDLRIGRESIDAGLRTLSEDPRGRRLEPTATTTLQSLEKLDKMLNDFAARMGNKKNLTGLEQLFRDDAKNIRPVTESYRRYVAAKGKESWAEAEKAAEETTAGWKTFQARHVGLTSQPDLKATMRVFEALGNKK